MFHLNAWIFVFFSQSVYGTCTGKSCLLYGLHIQIFPLSGNVMDLVLVWY
jgi:hypothetical protein